MHKVANNFVDAVEKTEVSLTVTSWKDRGREVIVAERKEKFSLVQSLKSERSKYLFLGGAESQDSFAVTALTGERYSEGFYGCIRFLKIEKKVKSGKKHKKYGGYVALNKGNLINCSEDVDFSETCKRE